MKIILLFFIFFTKLLASEYLIYSDNSQIRNKLINKYKATYVFTDFEKTLLQTSIKNVLKLKIANKDLPSLKSNCPKCKIEFNHKASIQNRYQKHQWSLKNKGEPFKRWISDIDVQWIKGVKGEDLNLDNLKETQNKIRVAVIDSGVDLNHPDLIGQFYENKKECEDLKAYNLCLKTQSNRDSCHKKYALIDHNKNGYPLDCNGWNVTGKSNPFAKVTGSANIKDNNGHGTHVAGIIGAKDNQIGIKGLIQNVELLPVQVGLSSYGDTSEDLPTDNIAKGVLYAIQNKAQIINMSLGWRINQDSLLMRDIIKLALKKNILIVVAAGNDSHDETVYPCSYQGVICVASHDVDGKLSSFSNFGPHIDLTAPGNNILSTFPTHIRSKRFTEDPNYEYMSGTSQATPHVTGILAILLNQGLGPKDAHIKLLKGTRSKNKTHQWIRNGNLDLKSALTSSNSFIQIVNKSPLLINTQKESQLRIKIDSNIKAQIELNSNDLILSKSVFQINPQTTKIQTSIIKYKTHKKSYFLKATMKGSDFDQVYYIQINPITVISPDAKNKRISSFNVVTKAPFSADIVRIFNNFFDKNKDYLSIKKMNGITYVKGIIQKDNIYQHTSTVKLATDETLILNISKVDIDQDSSPEYVITRVDLKDPKRKLIFKVLTENFSISPIQISPQNQFTNTYTTMPGEFYWVKRDNLMVPTWISFGLDPDYIRTSPWLPKESIEKKYRLYQLTSTGLRDLEIQKKISPVSFIFPSIQDQLKGIYYFISSIGSGHKKTYGIYKFEDSNFEFITHVNTKFYFNFLESNPLPLVGSNKNGAFFAIATMLGHQRVLALEVNSNGVEVVEDTIQSKEKIIRILRYDMKGNWIGQSRSRLISSYNNRIQSKISYTDARRIRHYLLHKRMGVILSQNDTFNLSSHGIIANKNGVQEPIYLQTYALPNCLEIGIERSEKAEFLTYFCEKDKKVLKLKVSL